jgi:hypothetical protein
MEQKGGSDACDDCQRDEHAHQPAIFGHFNSLRFQVYSTPAMIIGGANTADDVLAR